MQFDETRYVEDFIKKHRGARTVPGDLISRYSITLPATDAEIGAKVQSVRAYWDNASKGSSMAARIAEMCRAEDKRLRAEHGAAMETSAWWQQQQSARQSAAEALIKEAAASLRQHYGPLRAVSRGALDKSAALLKLTPHQAAQAVEMAGLRVLTGVSVPEAAPIAKFSDLLECMAECGAASVPDLVHPGAGPFSIIERYACRDHPSKRLDEDAVAARTAQAEKRGISAADNARLAALRILRTALQSGVDLRDVALYHLISVARDSPSTDTAKAELRESGLEAFDAEVIAVLAAEERAVADLSGSSPGEPEINAGDADEQSETVPLASPGQVHADWEGSAVTLSWLPGPGHNRDTVYAVRRTQEREQIVPTDGVPVYRGKGTTCTDAHVPVARVVQYGVFAVSDNLPSSRPATTSVTLLPPVSQLGAETGPDWIALHWSAHPEAEVEVIWTAPGEPPMPLPVTRSAHELTGLVEGQAHHFEVTAIYLTPDGTELRSAPEQISVTPRAKPQPVQELRARTVEDDGGVRVRIWWTPVDSSEVRIIRSDAEPAWPFGAEISAEELAAAGHEVTGDILPGQLERGLETVLPTGLHYLLPVSVGGTGFVIGRCTMAAVVDPVRHLTVTPFATYATVSWKWPPGAESAELGWKIDGDAGIVRIDQEQYTSGGGVRIPLGHAPSAIEVRAVVIANGASFTSPPVHAVIRATVDPAIPYDVSNRGAGWRRKTVVFSCDQSCRDVRIRMVASQGLVMPTSPAHGVKILEATLALDPGVPSRKYPVTIPGGIEKPFWVRCFIVQGRARLVDPPVSHLKET
jgi:hypothetical protein